MAAMKKAGVTRFIAISTPSAQDPNDESDWRFDYLLIPMIKLFVSGAYEDIVATAKVIRESGLDWTLVRIPFLTNNPRSGNVSVGYVGQVGVRLSRENLADFMLLQVTETKYIQKAPAISGN